MPHDVCACPLRRLKYTSCTGHLHSDQGGERKRRRVSSEVSAKESVAGKMKSICVLRGILGLAFADPTVYFVEKFETGGWVEIDI